MSRGFPGADKRENLPMQEIGDEFVYSKTTANEELFISKTIMAKYGRK